MEIALPEEILGIKPPKISWHHGTCDMCETRFVFVLHFNYDKQPKRDFRICEKCFEENDEIINMKWEKSTLINTQNK